LIAIRSPRPVWGGVVVVFPRLCWPAVTTQTSFDHHQRHTYRQ
jgi:hypothetical protein